MNRPLLQACQLGVTLRVQQQRIALLRDLSFEVRAGEVLGIVGESGAGKSLLTRVLAQQLPDTMQADHGELWFAGQNLLAAETNLRELLGRRIAFIPQEPMTALNPVLTISTQLNEHFQHLAVPRSHRTQRAIAALAEVGLEPSVLQRYPHQLSGGQCQRVMIALAFASQPELVICDEATTALDTVNQHLVLQRIRYCQQQYGTAVLFITHDLELAARLCDQIMVMYAGDMMEYGPTEQLLQRPQHPYTRALLRSRPSLTGAWQPLIPLAGQMPSAATLNQITGCRFHERCVHASDHCQQPVALQHRAASHQLRCRQRELPDEETSSSASPFDAAYAFDLLGSRTPFLEVQHLSKTYTSGRWGKRHHHRALHDVSLQLAPGEFVGIVGASGSGKSTLAKTLMGLEQANQGRVLLHGQALEHSESDWQRRIDSIQMVFQDPHSALNPTRRIDNLLTQRLESRHQLPLARQRRAQQLAADVGLNPLLLTRYPSSLSGGQRQRVNIGRALCDVPQLLIADEIVSGLDVSVQAQILNLLLQLRREYKISLLLISHDLAVVRYLCSRVLVMQAGEIVDSGDPRILFANPQHSYTRALVEAAQQPFTLGDCA